MTSTSATKQDLKKLETKVDKRFEQVDKRFEQVDKRFEQVDKRFEQVDKRFEQVDKRFDKLELKMERLFAESDRRSEERFDKMMELSHINAMESMKYIGERFEKNERAHQMLKVKVADNTADIMKLKHASK